MTEQQLVPVIRNHQPVIRIQAFTLEQDLLGSGGSFTLHIIASLTIFPDHPQGRKRRWLHSLDGLFAFLPHVPG